MPDLNAIPGITALRSHTQGDPRIKIAVLDGPIDLDRACFQGANITRLDPYWLTTCLDMTCNRLEIVQGCKSQDSKS